MKRETISEFLFDREYLDSVCELFRASDENFFIAYPTTEGEAAEISYKYGLSEVKVGVPIIISHQRTDNGENYYLGTVEQNIKQLQWLAHYLIIMKEKCVVLSQRP